MIRASQLNNTKVPFEMYELARERYRMGTVNLVVMEGDDSKPIQCANCNDLGSVALEWYTVGPSSSPTRSNKAPGDAAMGTVSINGKWYQHQIIEYECPICQVR